MTHQIGLWAASVVLTAALVWCAYYAPRRRIAAVIGAFAMTIALTFGSYFLILSHPAPLSWAGFAAVERASVLGAHLKEGEGIYLLTLGPGEPAPRYFVLPWERGTAEALQKALKDAERDGTRVELSWPAEDSLERRGPMFHAPAQPALPPKQPEAETRPEA